MRKKIRASIVMLIFLLLAAGCDSFSLLDRFYHADELQAPEILTVSTVGVNFKLTWSYPVSGIDGFWIMYSEGGKDFVLLATEDDIGSEDREHVCRPENGIQGGTEYIFRMYAVLDEQLSLPSDLFRYNT